MGTHKADRQPDPAAGSVDGRRIVAFDFDGTLTTHDSFTAFLAWKAEPFRYFVGLARLLPHLAVYAVTRDRGRLKAAAAAVFLEGEAHRQIDGEAEAFAAEKAHAMFRPDALQTWRDWQAKGALMVIVTASPETLVAPFARRLGAERLIGTQLAFDDQDRITGRFATPNCRGPEKVARLKQAFGDDVTLAAAYGDTAGDREMLQLAQVKGYRVFTGRP
ncbi:MAG TPA: HAD-IB family hydrolase [Caulobacteraceae bacterium]|nr:HAD-IB family hydrolase [Caulobacteraceae bacterium]